MGSAPEIFRLNQIGRDVIIGWMRTLVWLTITLTLWLLSACDLWRDHKASTSLPNNSAPAREWSEIAATGPSEPEEYGEPQQIGKIVDPAIAEVSGITASRTAANVWWVHNDGGGAARIYAISSQGKLLAAFDVTGAQNRDWEDIGSGPGRDGAAALYIADIGDNDRSRDELVIYRVKEPDLSRGIKSGSTEPAEAFPFRYPDGRHNAEAIFVDPQSGRIYLITKTQRQDCGVYRFPLPLRAGWRVTLEPVKGRNIGEIARLRLVTGAATSPDGSRVVIRTYFSAVELRRAAAHTFETIFDSDLGLVHMPIERQGEAIAYTIDGKSVVTTSERLPAPIYQVRRKRP